MASVGSRWRKMRTTGGVLPCRVLIAKRLSPARTGEGGTGAPGSTPPLQGGLLKICHWCRAPSLRISIEPVPKAPRGMPESGRTSWNACFLLESIAATVIHNLYDYMEHLFNCRCEAHEDADQGCSQVTVPAPAA